MLTLLSILSAVSVADSQTPDSGVTAAKKHWDLMVGDWTMVGMAKDSAKGAEYAVAWTLHGVRILDGMFVQVDQAWKGDGQESHTREIVSYDPVSRTHSTHGYSDDGSTWVGKGTYRDHTLVEEGTTTGMGGRVTKWRDTYVYSADWMSVTGSEEVETDGINWTSFTVKGTKSGRPD